AQLLSLFYWPTAAAYYLCCVSAVIQHIAKENVDEKADLAGTHANAARCCPSWPDHHNHAAAVLRLPLTRRSILLGGAGRPSRHREADRLPPAICERPQCADLQRRRHDEHGHPGLVGQISMRRVALV